MSFFCTINDCLSLIRLLAHFVETEKGWISTWYLRDSGYINLWDNQLVFNLSEARGVQSKTRLPQENVGTLKVPLLCRYFDNIFWLTQLRYEVLAGCDLTSTVGTSTRMTNCTERSVGPKLVGRRNRAITTLRDRSWLMEALEESKKTGYDAKH